MCVRCRLSSGDAYLPQLAFAQRWARSGIVYYYSPTRSKRLERITRTVIFSVSTKTHMPSARFSVDVFDYMLLPFWLCVRSQARRARNDVTVIGASAARLFDLGSVNIVRKRIHCKCANVCLLLSCDSWVHEHEHKTHVCLCVCVCRTHIN